MDFWGGKEIEWIIEKAYISHWLFHEFQTGKFVVPSNNHWDMHPVTFPDIDYEITVIAETKRGPSILL